MGKDEDLELVVQTGNDENLLESTNHSGRSKISHVKDSKRWLRIGLQALFVLIGQSAAIFSGRMYYNKGGKSKWLATLVQLIGFPLLVPYHCMISKSRKTNPTSVELNRPRSLVLAFTYISLGLLLTLNNVLYSIGLLNLPVSMFSLICVSQLAFNALFSFFLNSQKLTPYIINAIFLLTVSSSLILFSNNEENPSRITNDKYRIGLVCAVGSSAGYGLMISLTQLSFEKVLKTKAFESVLEMIICQSTVATCAATLGLYVSGEWKGLRKEMEEFESGTSLYFVTLGSSVVAWQVFTVGTTGLIFEVSSLFSNIIGVLGLPFVSVLAVFFADDAMDRLKATAILLALWGFGSYLYQHYLDISQPAECSHIVANQHAKEISMVPLLKEIGN